MTTGSVWSPENIRDVAESVGAGTLNNEVTDHLTRDIEFRIAQVLEEAFKFMRHAKRTTLFTQDITQALRALDAEPLYGYESTRPLKFGEASIGPGQPLYYLEDEEVDFEKLINAPLPKVPREICFTAHWLAVEGVQPKIPQNPTPAGTAARNDLLPKGPGANAHLAATAGADNLAVKPLVRHVLSSELQLYFEHVCAAVLDESNDEYRVAALSSLRSDPGLHQLVPYFVQFVAEKVTHNLKSLFVLSQMLHLVSALLGNPHLHITPYVAALVPPVLTCLIGKKLGPAPTDHAAYPPASSLSAAAVTSQLPLHYAVRDLAASLVTALTRKEFAAATPTLKPRLARTLLKVLLSASVQPLGSYFGAVRGLSSVAGAEGVRVLLLPNLGALDEALKEVSAAIAPEGSEEGRSRRREVDKVVEAVVDGLELLEQDAVGAAVRGAGDGDVDMEGSEEEKAKVCDKVGEVVGERVMMLGRKSLVKAILMQDIDI